MKLHLLNPESPVNGGCATWGCMWEQGRCTADTVFRCVGENGQAVPVQSRVTAWWPDGSVKWTAHTAACAQIGKAVEVLPAEKETPCAEGLSVEENGAGFMISCAGWRMRIPGPGAVLFETMEAGGRVCLRNARPELILEEPAQVDGCSAKLERRYMGRIDAVTLEERGPLQVTVRYTGTHQDARGETRLPFILRMRLCADSPRLHFTHTFLYDGDENRDFLRGIGLAVETPLQGAIYNRHMKLAGDHGVLHEVMVGLTSWRPRLPVGLYQRQLRGELLTDLAADSELSAKVDQVLSAVPYWSAYDFCQDSAEHFSVRKKLAPADCCLLDVLHGHRAKGTLAFGGEQGGLMLCIRDGWQKYPSGCTVEGLDSDAATCRVWFRHPDAEAMDFRHYAQRGYNQVCYEGYDYKGATPYGIACTGECDLLPLNGGIPEDQALYDFAKATDEPPVYVADPETYHALHAFGYWSLPRRSTETERWLEDQLDALFDFYRQETEQRGWYGLFNYGDFMHTYDAVRHQWKYDVGGYAWDNTELVPTLWLWNYFLRTGRADAFRLAEKLSRHASEVDVYHFGRYKGLGSRHNVRHWGCPCKEARIAMAHHHRVYYYLTGDFRLTDIFEELKDNELSFLNKDPLGDFYDKKGMVYPSHARSGPDWSSLCSNWMTQWERTNDPAYRDKIRVGMEDLKQMPLRLISGPDFEFDPHSLHLRYIGERTTGGTHLQICMGAPTIWTEMADLLKDPEWERMMAEYGRFYFLPDEQKQTESHGLIGSREFSLPFMAAAMGAYAAAYLKDRETARRTWAVLLHTLTAEGDHRGFAVTELKDQGNRAMLREIPWISTNFAAQFGLNCIIALEWIREELPPTLAEVDELVCHENPWFFHKA